jgi:hypothetical protein
LTAFRPGQRPRRQSVTLKHFMRNQFGRGYAGLFLGGNTNDRSHDSVPAGV